MVKRVQIARNLMGLGLLTIENNAQVPGYVLPDDTLGPGTQTKRRTTVESPWVPGRFATSIVPDTQEGSVTIHCRALDGAGLHTMVKEVLDALDQFRFQFYFEWNNVKGSWTCESADYSVGPSGIINDFDMSFYELPILATLPHEPMLPSYPADRI